MKRIDSDALNVLTKALGLSGAGSQITELADGIVDQALDVVPIIRRGRSLATSQGLFMGLLRNVHTDAESLETSVAPYNVAVGAVPPYPSPMPEQFDVWLLGASSRRLSGGGTQTASLSIDYPNSAQGFGVDDSGVAVVGVGRQKVALWDTQSTGTTVTFGLLNGSRGPFAKIGLRIRRSPGVLITYASTSSITATFECDLLLGVFPVSLGQDVFV